MMTRMLEMADASLAARRRERRLGMAMAAMMPMIATTISSSISEKPFWPFFVCICFTVLLRRKLFRVKKISRAVGPRLRLRAVARDFGHASLKQEACQRPHPCVYTRKHRVLQRNLLARRRAMHPEG